MTGFLLGILVAAALCVQVIDACPKGIKKGWYANFEGVCYHLVDDREYDWKSASRVCQANGGRLGAVPNKAVNEFVLNGLVPEAKQYWERKKHMWIGAVKNMATKAWVWDDGDSHVEYSDWADGEPDESVGNRNCAVMSESLGWKWIAVSCTAAPSTYYILCQYEAHYYDDGVVHQPAFHVGVGVGVAALVIICIVLFVCRRQRQTQRLKYKERLRKLETQLQSTPAPVYPSCPSSDIIDQDNAPPPYGPVVGPGALPSMIHPPTGRYQGSPAVYSASDFHAFNDLNLDRGSSKKIPDKRISVEFSPLLVGEGQAELSEERMGAYGRPTYTRNI